MSLNDLGNVAAGSTIPLYWTSHDAATGATETMSGLAVTDIEIYKGTSITQRSSDNGYALIDTDGIDVDSVTGLNAISIDLSDNSDAGFFAAGSFYNVILTPVTVDGQTLTIHLATFHIVAADPLTPTTAGRTLDVSAGGEAGVDWANVGSPTTANALTATSIITTQKVDVDTIKTNPVVNGGTLTFPTTATLASTTNITAGTVTTATNVTTVNGLAANVITATAIAADAIGASELAADAATEIGTAVWASATRELTALDEDNTTIDLNATAVGSVAGAVGSVTGAVGSVTGNVGGNVTGSVGSIPAATLTAGERNSVADALLDRAAGVETGVTPRQGFRLMLAALAGKLSGAATTTVKVRDTGDAKDRITATVDADGNRTAVTLDAS